MPLTDENKIHLRQSVISADPSADIDHRDGSPATSESRKRQADANVMHALRAYAGGVGARWDEMGLWSDEQKSAVNVKKAELDSEKALIYAEIYAL